MTIRASFKDTCRGCGERVDVGDEIHWNPDDGPRCEDCGPAPDEPRGAVTGLEDAPGYVRVLEKRIDKLEAKNADLESKIDKQYEDKTALEMWAKKLSAELDVPGPEMPA